MWAGWTGEFRKGLSRSRKAQGSPLTWVPVEVETLIPTARYFPLHVPSPTSQARKLDGRSIIVIENEINS